MNAHRDHNTRNENVEIARKNALFADTYLFDGLEGRDRDRTCDPLDVNEVLSR